MKTKLINSQLTNMLTIQSYKKRMCSMAENVFLIKNLPELIDVGYMNSIQLKIILVSQIKHIILQREIKALGEQQ